MGAVIMPLALLCVMAAIFIMTRLAAGGKKRITLDRLHAALAPSKKAAPVSVATAGTELPVPLSARFVRAGWEPDRRHLVMTAGLLLIVGLVTDLAAGMLAAFVVITILVLTGLAVLEYRGTANMRMLSDAMLGFLERMQQLLSVGHSLPVALRRAAENSPPVVARSLAPTIRRIDNGAGFADSIERCADELDIYELHLLATATRTNLRFGGSMTNVLKNMMENIRKRAAIERELRANTTQIRASAWVLALLPVLVGALVMLSNRSYARWFLVTPTGHAMIAYAVVSQLLGGLCMRVIVRTRL